MAALHSRGLSQTVGTDLRVAALLPFHLLHISRSTTLPHMSVNVSLWFGIFQVSKHLYTARQEYVKSTAATGTIPQTKPCVS